MSLRREFPTLADVIALAERHDADVSAIELARMHKRGEFSDKAAHGLWPAATPRYFAMVTGRTRYDGAPCKHCGNTLRNVSSRTCVPCHLEHKRGKHANSNNWHKENRDYLRVYLQAYRAKRKELAS
jgi:hypothetical protein